MALWPQFIGPAYRARSQNIAADLLINLYAELTENTSEAKQWTYYGTPGLKHLTTFDTVGSRGWFAQDNVTVAVVGDTVYLKSDIAPPVSASVDVLLVGAGGGGAKGSAVNRGGGGGGAGGLVTDTQTLSTGAYTVTIGAGGAGSASAATAGSKGGDTSVTGFTTATGGGGGGSADAGAAPTSGGCGGGAGDFGGVFSPGGGGLQGFPGGSSTGSGGSGASGAGGGGMSSAGTDAAGVGVNPAGGSGLSSNLSGAAVTYAAGGRGGTQTGAEAGPAGAANTGNGGGGGGGAGTGAGGAGGSGVVIFSYASGGMSATGGTITTAAGRTIHTFTAGGTFTVAASPAPPSGSAMFVSVGTLPNDGLPVSIASNGRGGEQIAIVGGGQLKILSLVTRVLSAAVTLPLTNAPVQVDFLDGYFVLAEANTVRVWFSTLENGLLWDALDFFAVSLTSTNVVGIKVFRDRLWVFQSQSSLVYYDSGDADNPFVPYPGSVMQEGAVTPWGIVVLGEEIFWLAQDNQGQNRMVSAVNYAPVVISTPAISFALASYDTITDAEVLAYEQEGHPHLCWTFPTGDQTWVYDTRTQQWHERSTYDATAGLRHRWRARGTCVSDGQVIVGDAVTGDVYTLDLDTFTDNGATIQRVRRAPYLSAENQWMFIDRFELGIQSGVGLVDGSDPHIMLSLSRDSGYTWTPPTSTSMGAIGNYLARAIWRKLGRVRADRLVIEVTQTDPVRSVWGPGAWIKARPGSGQL